MEYSIYPDKIVISGLEDFNISHILECGQVFRFEKTDIGYNVYSLDKKATVLTDYDRDMATIYTNDTSYFVKYFDLDTSYSDIKSRLKNFNLDFLTSAIDKYYGIRILHQDIYEAFFSFMISQNNNIKRIQKIINSLCTIYGKKMDGYYAFPTLDTLKCITKQQFMDIGLGYRADYFVKTLQKIDGDTLYNLADLSKEELKKELTKFCGVGEKVADCVMLFGYSKPYSFPCDVWIEKMYNQYFGEEKNRDVISKKLVSLFGDLSGYAQQYLFFYIRTLGK